VAGEWIPYDVCLPQKPEVLELVDRTGLPPDQVVGRLLMLWGWAALNSADGTARMSVRLLARLCGGDEEFWREVEAVGWLVIDAENGTIGIPGWDSRFSKAAKSRSLATVRHQVDKVGGATRPRSGRDAPPRGAQRARERGERRDRNSSSSPGVAALAEDPDQAPQEAPDGPAGWETVRKAWAATVAKGHGKPWGLAAAPDKLADRLDEDGWFEKFLAALGRLPACRYFRDPVTLPQLVAPGFVDKVLGGQFDNAREQRPAGGYRGLEDRPPAQGFTGADAEAFERTKRALAAKIRQEGAA
jgi:hypothetical protein